MSRRPQLLDLPAEIRIAILEYVFGQSLFENGLQVHQTTGYMVMSDNYSVNECLRPLLVCRQMYEDGKLLALNRTNFVVSNPYYDITERLTRLQPKQLAAIRSIAFVAEARAFRNMIDWRHYPFDTSSLQLDTLTIILHRGSSWHYLYDFTAGITALLRRLRGVQRVIFVRNDARVKGFFHTWYNRLVGLIMKVDHHGRYDQTPTRVETTWWKWEYDRDRQRICLEAQPPKPVMGEEAYMQMMLPLIEEMRISMEKEEWNPDPRTRIGTY